MSYRLLKPSDRGASRMTDTFSVNSRGIVLNAKMQRALGISPGSHVALFVNDDGFLCFMPAKEGDEGARRLSKLDGGQSKLLAGRDVARHCARGRYRITGRGGAFHVTDCRWKEKEVAE